MRKFSVLAALLLMFQLILPISPAVNAEENAKLLNYLALGDSLAAGVNENSELGLGYADFIAKKYVEQQGAIAFNKGFSYPGYTTNDVLNDIEANVTKPIYDLNGLSQNTVTIQQAIQQADIITLSVGANDVLKNVTRTEAGGFTFDPANVLKGIQDVAANYDKIFASIYAINPDVDIIVMGLYNPFPYIQNTATQTQLNMLVSAMNNSVKGIVEKNSGIFSETVSLIASNTKTYLPNPENIHLSEAGYQVVANAMLEDYAKSILAEVETLITEGPFADTKNHWGKEYIDVAYSNGYLKGYEDGTFKPNTDMTRVQVLSVIARAFDLTATNKAPFKDIAQYPQQTQDEIAAAYEAGLIRENGGYLNPQNPINRSQLALILMRLTNGLTGENYEPTEIAPFKDIKNYDAETQAAITFLYDLGVVQGTTATTFSPKGNITRAQLAKILVLLTTEY